MSDNDFNIKITTSADTTGAKQTARDLSSIQAAGIQSAAGLQESGKAAAFAGAKKKDLKDIIKNLGHAFPELSSLVYLLKNPFVALAAAVAAVTVYIKGFFDEVKRMGEAVDAFDQLNKAGIGWKTIAAELVALNNEFGESQRKAKEEAEGTAAALEHEVTALQHRAEEQKKHLEAEKALALVQAGDDPIAKAAIEKKFGRAAFDVDIQTKAHEATLKEGEARRLENMSPILKDRALAELGDAKAGLREEINRQDPDRKALEIREESVRRQMEKIKGAQVPRFDPAHPDDVRPRSESERNAADSSLRQELRAIQEDRANLDALSGPAKERVKKATDRFEQIKTDAARAPKLRADAHAIYRELEDTQNSALGSFQPGKMFDVESSRPDSIQRFSGPHSSGGIMHLIGNRGAGRAGGGTMDINELVESINAKNEKFDQLQKVIIDSNERDQRTMENIIKRLQDTNNR